LSKYAFPGLQLEIGSLEPLEYMLQSFCVFFYGAPENNNIIHKHIALICYQVPQYDIHKALETGR